MVECKIEPHEPSSAQREAAADGTCELPGGTLETCALQLNRRKPNGASRGVGAGGNNHPGYPIQSMPFLLFWFRY
jgi:hypothetical protein